MGGGFLCIKIYVETSLYLVLLVSTAPVEVIRRPKGGQHLIFTENTEDEQDNNTEVHLIVNKLIIIICM